MIQTTALLGDSMMVGNEVIVWTAVLVGLFFFHSLLNVIIQPGRTAATESEDRLEYQ